MSFLTDSQALNDSTLINRFASAAGSWLANNFDPTNIVVNSETTYIRNQILSNIKNNKNYRNSIAPDLVQQAIDRQDLTIGSDPLTGDADTSTVTDQEITNSLILHFKTGLFICL